MHGTDLQPWIDHWLSGHSRRWHLRFAAKLEATFERDTGAERGRTMALFAVAGCLAYLLWDLAGVLSSVTPRARFMHAALAIPVGGAMALLLRHRLRPFWRETAASLLTIGSSASLTALYATGAWNSAALATTGVVISMLIGAQVLQLRFPFALPSIVIMAAMQAAALSFRPPDGSETVLAFDQTLAISAAIALLASWRQERDNRRIYLLGLKDRLGRQALSQHNRELDDLARRDPLTGLPNRRAFDAWLRTPIGKDSADRLVSMIAIDIDFFKPFNDHYGHPAGDHCLRQVATCLREKARGQTDLLARIGGEEFAMLLVGRGTSEATQLAENLREAVEALALPHEGPGAGGYVTISAGVAHAFVLDNIPLQALAQRADAALYEAKQEGRNRVRVAG